MSCEIEHEKWIKGHLKRREGERKDALKRGHWCYYNVTILRELNEISFKVT